MSNRRRNRRLVVVLGILTALLALCAYSHVWEGELPGTYVGAYSYGTEVIELKKDGTFVQTLPKLPGLSVNQIQGTWHYRADLIQGDLVLDGAINIDDGFGSARNSFAPAPGQTILMVKRSFGRVIVVRNEDVGLELRRRQVEGGG